MDKDSSFNYVFWDILKYVENVEITYQHEARLTTYEDQLTPDGNSQWCLSLISVCDIRKYKDLNEVLAKSIDSIINYIQENRLDLYTFYKYFVERLEKGKEKFKNLQRGKIKFENLINQKIIVLKYLGYLPFDEHFHFRQLGISGKPIEAKFDEKAFDELHKMTKHYFEVIIKELTRLILFLKHELNLSIINKQQLENQKGKEEFINLIKRGKIEKLFEELDATEDYKYDEDIILLSSRYFKLENEKNQNVIMRNEYDTQFAKLISSLIKAISKH